ncbi:MAG: hypothetical protein QXU13_01815 [Desulfurococcaceae archaeon]
MARSISPVISILMLFSITLSIVLSVYFYTLYLNEAGRYASQYGFVKNQLISMAIRFPEIVLNKGNYMFNYPYDVVGIGYKTVDHAIYVVLMLDNESTLYRVFQYKYELAVYVKYPLVSEERAVYNIGNKLAVDKLGDVPFIKEYYRDGFTVLEFSVLNVFKRAFKINASSENRVVYEVWVFKILPRIIDQGSLVVSTRDELAERITGVKSLSIYIDNDAIFSEKFTYPVDVVLRSILLEVTII